MANILQFNIMHVGDRPNYVIFRHRISYKLEEKKCVSGSIEHNCCK